MTEAPREAVIEVRGLVTRFGTHVVHEGLDLDVYRGEVLGVVGGSGTGKSVLLRAIVGLKQPDSGSVRVFGKLSYLAPFYLVPIRDWPNVIQQLRLVQVWREDDRVGRGSRMETIR